jgi:hypothetical protein
VKGVRQVCDLRRLAALQGGVDLPRITTGLRDQFLRIYVVKLQRTALIFVALSVIPVTLLPSLRRQFIFLAPTVGSGQERSTRADRPGRDANAR